MKAIILSAGQGTRLLPLTADRPKCLVRVGDRTILEHQVDALRAAGVEEIVVVGGYHLRRLRDFMADRWGDAAPRLVFNPFYGVSSSISSVWAAREALEGPFCLMNGDTIFDADLVARALASAGHGVGLVVEHVESPQLDDMRVRLAGDRVLQVSKDLSPLMAWHRSLGLIVAGERSPEYLQALEEVVSEPGGTNAYHHDIIDRLARRGVVSALVAEGRWGEIDNSDDIARWLAMHGGMDSDSNGDEAGPISLQG